MLNLLKRIYSDLEGLKGRKLVKFLLMIFISFIIIGFFIGYINQLLLNKDEPSNVVSPENGVVSKTKSYTGRVVYIDPFLYKDENIVYALENLEGKQVILLTAKDKKLEVLEGLDVEVKGTLFKTKDGAKDVLLVSEVVMHASN